MDSWPACNEFAPSPTDGLLRRGGRCTLNLLRLKHPPVGTMRKLGEVVPAQVPSSSLDHGSKLRDSSPKALE
ncbi:hypothetical protein TNCV_4171371 [Trichonephila clavipes]|nr:hypothetical protein TNCV_4171371 [Trichonephila clavipes]